MTMKYTQYQHITKFVLTLLFATLSLWAYSIPFTGGDLSYKRIKNGVYEFTLVLERDCRRYSPNFEFEDRVTVGAYNLRNELIGECGELGKIFLDLQSITKKENNLSSACIDADDTECREIAVYKGTANVPISAYGYQFIYSECCRPDNIVNIFDPENAGFTLIATMTLNGYLWYTSTPVFSNTDPLYSCLGEENTINPGISVKPHEEYRFSLCNPFDGQAPVNPLLAPQAPPYDYVDYVSGFTALDPLGDDGDITIDPSTGVITYTGSKAGSYSIAVCVEQFKKGKLVGTSIREIQLNFIDCAGKTLDADFDYTVDFCNPGRVSFENRSMGADDFEWTFYTDESTSSTSTNPNPVMTFPSPGSYVVELAISNNEGCVDTARKVVEVYDFIEEIQILNFGSCQDLTQELSLNKEVQNYEITWYLVDGNSESEIGTGTDISYLFPSEGPYTIRVEAAYEDCIVSATRTINVVQGVTALMDTIAICSPEIVALNPNSYDRYKYTWTIDSLIEDKADPNPRVFVSTTTLFPVTITDKQDPNCSGEGFVLVTVGESQTADFKAVQDLCADEYTVKFSSISDGVTNLHWSFQIGSETIESDEESPVITFPTTGYYKVILAGDGDNGCPATGTRVIEVFDPENDLGIVNFGNCENYEQVLKLDKVIEGYEIAWTLIDGDNETEIGTGDQVTYDFGAEGNYTVRAEISNPECTVVVENILVVKLGVTVPKDTIDLCESARIQLNPVTYEGYTYQWLNTDLIDDVNNPSPVVDVDETTRFEVVVSDKNDPTCVDTGFVLVRVDELALGQYKAFQDLCAEGYFVRFSPAIHGVVEAKWRFSIGGEVIESSEMNPVIEYPETGFYDVSLVVVTSQGCTDSLSQIVQVYDPATDLEITNFGNCENYEQVLKLDKPIEGFEITWTLLDGDTEIDLGSGNQITYDFGEAGQYRVRAEISNPECTVVVEDILLVELGVTVPRDTIDLCVEGNITLNPVSYEGYDYQWLNSDLIDNTNDPSPVVNVTQTTRFEVVVTDKNDPNCVDTGFVWIRVNELPIADFNAVYDICDVDKTMKFEPVRSNLISTTWYFDGNDGSKTSTASNPSFTYEEFGSYEVTLIAESAQGCTDTLTKTVVVDDFFALLDFKTNGSCEGLDYTLELNDPAIGYEVNWYLDDAGELTEIGQGVNLDYTFAAPGMYDIRVELANAECARSFVRTLQVTDGIQAPDTTIVVCDPKLIALNPYGRNDLTYTWTPTDNLDDPTSYNPMANITENITYQVTVEIQDGDTTCSATGSVQVILDQSTDSIAFDTTTLTICEGDVVFLNEGGDTTFNYYWQPESFFEDARVVNPSAQLFTSQEFTVTITNSETGCSSSFRKQVNVIPINDLLDIDYSFECGETVATLIALDVPLDGDIEWTYGDSIISTEPTFDFDFGEYGTFEVTARLLGDDCIESSAQVTLINPDEFLFRDSIFLCESETVTLNPDGDTNLIYSWTGPNLSANDIASPTTTVEMNSIYNAIILHPDDTTCQTLGRVYVFIEMASDIISANKTEFCMGDTARLSVGNGGEPMNIQWSDPDGVLIGTDQMIEFPFEKMGEYTVVADLGGCTFMDTIDLQFRNVQIVASQTDGICPGDEVMLEVQFNTEEPYDSIVWGPENVVVSEANPAFATYTPDSNSIVTAWVYFSDGCLSMDTVMLQIPPALENLTISTDRDTLFRGEKATLTASDNGFVTYRWEPADYVDNPDQPQTEVIPETTTTFTLTAKDENGCEVQKTITIVVLNPQCEPPYVFVPRAFSPNGDGTNDILYVRGESIDIVHFIVYDRWGEKMFETNNLSQGWDGTFRGKMLPPDVYGYYLSVTCIGGDTYTEKGNVTIIR